MSNQLLLRRRMMMQSQSKGYIQDGLIMLLDGIDKGVSDGNWKDLVNRKLFTNAGGAVSIADGFRFDASDNSYLKSNLEAWDMSTHTIEVVITTIIKTWGVVFTCGSESENFNNCVSFRTLGSGAISSDGIRTNSNFNYYILPSGSTFINKKTSFSTNYDRAISNMQQCIKSSTTDCFSTKGAAVIGGRFWGGQTLYQTGRFIGDIHCIRVYNRKLTANEMLYNQMVDNVRYHLDLE